MIKKTWNKKPVLTENGILFIFKSEFLWRNIDTGHILFMHKERMN